MSLSIAPIALEAIPQPKGTGQAAVDAQKALPFVTAIIPCRNELGYIDKCLDSLIASDYPLDRMEVLVADGRSEDGTREVVESYAARYPWIRLLDNPKRILASAWNVGILAARGEIVVALNAHGEFNRSYISRCVGHLLSNRTLDCVGGVVKAIPKDDGLLGRAICLVLSSRFGVGNSHFRTGSAAPRLADTVAFGGYWRSLFDKVGLFNEELTRSQDMELHRRLEAAGCKILLDPSMYCHYFTRTRLSEFLRYSFVNGFWVTYPLRVAAVAIRLRHIVPLLFVLSLLAAGSLALSLPGAALPGLSIPLFPALLFAIVSAYVGANLYSSLRAAASQREPRYALLLPFLFLTLHVTYGLGSLWGLSKAVFARRFWHNLHRMLLGAPGESNALPQGR